ncbi:unnamed protein product [Musa acuminata subsp. malaccensis]|uniref:(wild Malaysian banana) hypothetical protein n=2 Tax=Musa acuminata TaxID=4641 RepID=A0A804I4I9_MUSAM|nr:PREDICTED: uncharacterized protein At1g27050-like [Musa acuminata subsp. malaccensis]CAG1862526.1 unnamed protein product [Musa acuminata subsp. malaccensis]
MKRRGKGERPKSDAFPASLSKRLRRPPPTEAAEGEPAEATAAASPSVVLVTGLPADCTVLELKSRLEMYGPISRTRIDVDGRGFVTFRSDHAAEAAISASLDPAFGVTVRSKKVLVVRASDPIPAKMGAGISSTSRLLRAEIPLSRHGPSKEKLDAGATAERSKSGPEVSHDGREIIAYDDLF